MKSVLLAATLLLVGGTAVACGGSDSSSSASDSSSSSSASASASASTDASGAASTDPSAAAFCTVLTSGTELKDGKDINALYKKLAATDKPDAIPDDASQGYDVYLKVLKGIDPSTTAAQLKAMTDLGLSTDEQTEVQAFFTYAAATCAPAAASGSAAPSDEASPSADASSSAPAN